MRLTSGGAYQGSGDQSMGGIVAPFQGRNTARRTRLLMQYLPQGQMSVNDMFTAANDPNTDDDTMLTQVKRTRRFARAQQYALTVNRNIASGDGDRYASQMQAQWEKMSRAERGYLRRNMGLKDPLLQRREQQGRDDDDGGFLGGLTDPLEAVIDVGKKGAEFGLRNTLGTEPGKAAMHALEYGQQKVAQGGRAAMLFATRNAPKGGIGEASNIQEVLASIAMGTPGYNALDIAGVMERGVDRYDADYLNEQDGHGLWAELSAAWEDADAADGEGAFLDADRQEAYRKGGRSRTNFQLAYYRASGLDDAAVAMKVAAKQLDLDEDDPDLAQNPEFSSRVSQLYERLGSPKVKRAQDVLDQGHMSPGRMFVRASLAPDEGPLFDMLSGAVDAAYTTFSDPLIVVGAINKGRRSAKLALDVTKDEKALGMAKHVGDDIDDRVAGMATQDPMDPKFWDELTAVERKGLKVEDRFNNVEKLVVAISKTNLRDPAQARMLFDKALKAQPKMFDEVLKQDIRTRLLPKNLPDMPITDMPKAADDAIGTADEILAEKLEGLGEGLIGVKLSPAEAKAVEDLAPHLQSQALMEKRLTALMDSDAATFAGTTGLDSPKAVLEAFDTVGAKAAYAGGAWDSRRYLTKQIPNITKTQITKNRVWMRTAEKVDDWRDAVNAFDEVEKVQRFGWFDDMDRIRFGAREGDVVYRGGMEQAWQRRIAQSKKLVGDMAFAMGQPAFNGVLPIMGRGALSQFDAALKMGAAGNREEMLEMWGRFAISPTAASRRVVADSATDAMMRAVGIHDIDPKTYKKWRNIAQGRMQNYSLSGMDWDLMGLGNSAQKKAALYMGQTADDAYLMPSFREMRESTAKAGMLRFIEPGVNSPLVSKLMERYWKPLMILRVGFVPRVVADELLPWVVRNGAGAPLKQWFVQPWHMYQADNQVPTLLKPLANAERNFLHGGWKSRWAEETEGELMRFADQLGGEGAGEVLRDVDLVFNRRGQKAFAQEIQAWAGSTKRFASRSTEDLIHLPNKRWARRYAAYSKDQIQLTKMLQRTLARATKGLMPADAPYAYQAIREDPVLLGASMDDITTQNAGFLEPKPHTANLSTIQAAVKDGDRIRQIPLRNEHTEYFRVERGDGDQYLAAGEQVMFDAATYPESRGGAAAIGWRVGDGHAISIGRSLELGEGVTAEQARSAILEYRRAFGRETSRTRDQVKAYFRAHKRDRPDLKSKLLDDPGLSPEIRHLIERGPENVGGNEFSALIMDERKLYGGVSDEAIARTQEAMFGESARRVGMDRDTFRYEYGKAKGTIWTHESGMGEVTKGELADAHETVARLEGEDLGVKRWATGEPLDDATRADILEGARGRFQQWLNDTPDNDVIAELRGDALTTDLTTLDERIGELDDLADDALDENAFDSYQQFADGGQQLRAWRDAVARRNDDAGYLMTPDDEGWVDHLFSAHRELNTDISDIRKTPAMGAVADADGSRIAARRVDADNWYWNGDETARDRMVKELHSETINAPRNQEAYQRMTRSKEVKTGEVKGPGDVDGYQRLYTPVMDEGTLRQAFMTIRQGNTVDPEMANILDSFVVLQRKKDPGFDIDHWLQQTTVNPDPIPIGAHGYTEQSVAQEIAERLHQVAGVDDIPEDVLTHHLMPNRLANATRIGPNQVMTTPERLAKAQPLIPSQHWTDPQVPVDDLGQLVTNDMTGLLVHSGEINHVMAEAIASGNPSAWHSAHLEADLLPESLMRSKQVMDADELRSFQKWIRVGFDEGVAPIVDGVIRNPMYLHELGTQVREADELLRRHIYDPAFGVTARRHFGGEAIDDATLYEHGRAVQSALKGFRALPDQKIPDRIAGSLARGHEPDFDLEFLEFAKGHGALPEGNLYREYLDEANARLGRATARRKPGANISQRAKIDQELKEVQRFFAHERGVRSQIHEAGAESAMDRVIPWIDDHRVRSQFSEIFRNVFPFFWAQEQTARRWIGSIAQNPVFVREMQLAMHGLRSMGVVRKDDYGNDIFVYPGNAALQEVVSRVPVFGEHAKAAVTIPLTGRVAFAVPFLQDMGVPSASPVISLPLRLSAEIIPEMGSIRDAVVPEGTEDSLFFSDVMPPVVGRLVHAVGANEDGDKDFAAATIQALSVMEQAHLKLTEEVEDRQAEVDDLIVDGAPSDQIADARKRLDDAVEARNNDGVPDQGATATQRDQFVERLGNVAKVMLATKAILGFVGPVAPQVDVGSPFQEEYQTLLKSMPVADAAATFIKRHPDATPWMVFGSETESGAPLQASPTVGTWMDSHEDTIKTYPKAAPWLAPTGDGSSYDRKAYAQQFSQGLRRRISSGEAWQEMKFREAAPAYFQMQEDFELAIAGEGDQARRERMEDEWADWRDSYLQIHSTFSEQLRSPSGQERRQAVKREMADMVTDIRVPESDSLNDVRQLVQAQADYDVEIAQFEDRRDGDTQRKKAMLRGEFIDWGDHYVADHPQLGALWRGVYRQELDPKDLLVDSIRLRRQGILYDTEPDRAPRPRSWATDPRY